MIDWLLDAIRTELIDPLCSPGVPEVDRCTFDDTGAPTHTGTNELTIAETISEPLDAVIGGGGTLRHTIVVVLECLDGDAPRARTRRGRLAVDLLAPVLADPSLGGARADDGTQELTALRWSIAWGQYEGSGGFVCQAAVTMTADCDWSPARVAP